jgi:hypothetical protein
MSTVRFPGRSVRDIVSPPVCIVDALEQFAKDIPDTSWGITLRLTIGTTINLIKRHSDELQRR